MARRFDIEHAALTGLPHPAHFIGNLNLDHTVGYTNGNQHSPNYDTSSVNIQDTVTDAG